MGNVGANGADSGRIPCGVPATGGKVEGKRSKGQFVAFGGRGQSNLGRVYTTAPGLLGQEAGNCGLMGVLTAYL